MPGKTNIVMQVITLMDKLKMIVRPSWGNLKIVYIATGLLLMSGILIVTITGALKNSYNANINPPPPVSFPPTASAKLEPASGPSTNQDTLPAEQLPAAVYQKKLATEPASAASSQVKTVTSSDSQPFSWPLKGEIKLEFGWQQHPVFKDWRYHTGIDIAGQKGQNVQAISDGEVTDIFKDRHSGLTVAVKYGKYVIYYGSLATVAVRNNDHINTGDKIGDIGKCDDEPYDHVHLSIKQGDKFIDPRQLLQ